MLMTWLQIETSTEFSVGTNLKSGPQYIVRPDLLFFQWDLDASRCRNITHFYSCVSTRPCPLKKKDFQLRHITELGFTFFSTIVGDFIIVS